mmetsp:Transcript_17942/g.15302  ORF Transcript_17942/g.15302 Transcript_17942/m.15302 type:complete len:90 (+) Transcript_17942:167-436(+)
MPSSEGKVWQVLIGFELSPHHKSITIRLVVGVTSLCVLTGGGGIATNIVVVTIIGLALPLHIEILKAHCYHCCCCCCCWLIVIMLLCSR